MNYEFWVIYDLATGQELWRGGGQAGSAAQQQLPDGAALLLVPQKVIASPELDLAALRMALMNVVDAQAEGIRMSFLTPGAGQAMTYQRKETEARAWTADNAVSTPFLSTEAAARGMTIADLAAEVIQLADTWTAIGSAIEGLRMGAKGAIAQATTLGAIAAAGKVNWAALLA